MGIPPWSAPRRPPLHQFPDGGGGRPVRFSAGALCRCWPPASPSPLAALPLGFTCFSPRMPLLSRLSLPTRALRPPPAHLWLPLLRGPAPSLPASASPLYSPPPRCPTRCHSEGRCLPHSVCTLLSAVTAFAVHSPAFSTLEFHLCRTPMSLPFPLESGHTLTLSSLKCYPPQAVCYPRNPQLSPQSGPYRYTARESFNIQTGMWSCMWMDG